MKRRETPSELLFFYLADEPDGGSCRNRRRSVKPFKNPIAKTQGKPKPKTRPGQNRAPDWKNKHWRSLAKRGKN